MERKTKIEITLAILLIFLCIALVVWFRMPADDVQPAQSTSTPSITTSPDRTTPSDPATGTDAPAEPIIKETSATTVARTFVERLGSYSSEADAANIEDILPMATVSFQGELNALVRETRRSTGDAYYGVSTVVITAPKTVSSTATQTVLSMTTQREETIDTPGNATISYQSITITLVKSGTTWLVDGYAWSEKM